MIDPDTYGFKPGAEEFPSIILVATASPCNAKCVHCPCTVKPEIRTTNDDFIRVESFKKIVDEAVEYDAYVRMSGYGEPLMHPQFQSLAEYGAKKGAHLSLITNGSLLHKHYQSLMDFDSVEISIDSHKEEIYKKIRRGLNFETVKNNITLLKDYRDKCGSKVRIMVSIIDQPSNNPDIQGAVDYWENEVDKVLLRKYVTWGVLPTADYGKPLMTEREPCPYPFERLMIDPAGFFRLCPYDDQRIIAPFGHISTSKIKEVWHGPRMEALRLGHLRAEYEDIELCGECKDFAYRSWTDNFHKALKDARSKK